MLETLLFLGAIGAVGIIVVKFIIEDGREKKAAASANAARTPLLQEAAPGRGWVAQKWKR